MRFSLKAYQEDAVSAILATLADAKEDYRQKNRKIAFALSAITGAGKTVMASATLEALFDGSEEFEIERDPTAVVLWVTDDPNLNIQTRYRIMEASDRLDASRLTIVGDTFNEEVLTPSHVFFLNRQKLTAKTFISRSDKRTFTLWDTIRNTIEDPDHTLYLVLDEAHRGMKLQSSTKSAADEKDRLSTVLRLINGHDQAPPVPIVWGISATVERFNVAMKDAADRATLPNIVVDNRVVQESGLLKDTIVLDLPDQSGAFATVLAREAAKACHDISDLWSEYAQREGLDEPVCPLLVVQVPNKPSRTELAALLDTVYAAWPDLEEDALANVFGEHTDETYGKHVVPYVPPQNVQHETHIRVLLAKDAISTGWDCPRAETLISLRPARDRTHITQLLGRLVRTPLARRIDSDERLNAVTCFLPHFDLKTAAEVADIMTGLRQDSDSSPPAPGGRVLIEPTTMLWNNSLPDDVRDCFVGLPSMAIPRTPTKAVRRMMSLAAELALDDLVPDPSASALEQIFALLDGQTAQHRSSLEIAVDAILTADIRRITANRLSLQATETHLELEADDRTVDDAFRSATRAFGTAIANGYVKRLAVATAAARPNEELDLQANKAMVAALARTPVVVEEVERMADEIGSKWLSSQHAAIKGLTEQRRAAYDDIKSQASSPQPMDIVLPTSRIEMTYELIGEERAPLPTRNRHLLADEHGTYPVGRLGAWELDVLDREMGREEAVAWYRNPSSASKGSIQVPWLHEHHWKSMQPDFIFFSRRADQSVGASIVDPHGHHLADAFGKLLGLADFGEEHADRFLRVESISKNDKGDLGTKQKGELMMLDLTDPKTRKTIRSSDTAADAYRSAGQRYE